MQGRLGSGGGLGIFLTISYLGGSGLTGYKIPSLRYKFGYRLFSTAWCVLDVNKVSYYMKLVQSFT